MAERGEILWRPDERALTDSALARFAHDVGHDPSDYAALWQWSVDEPGEFWGEIAHRAGLVPAPPDPADVLVDDAMPGARWFPGLQLNYAERVLAAGGVPATAEVVTEVTQTRDPRSLTVAELRTQVARCRAGLLRLGVSKGDRVVAYLPNIHETYVAFLATASIGAIWSSCAPEFGTQSVIDRWSQIGPSVLLTVDGYRYGDKDIDRREEVAGIRAALDSLRHTVVVPYLDIDASLPDTTSWRDLLGTDGPLEFAPVAVDHPLYVLYSSGTTGLPKPIVHGHGGITLEHHKALSLHLDLGPGDRFFWFSTTGWMMWNFLASGPLVGASIVLFDGDPGHPDLLALWQLAEEAAITFFGVSAPYLMACRKAGLTPGDDLDLSRIRGVGSTGAPLPADGFRWVYEAIHPDLQLSSISGGTDVCTAFVGAAPTVPVRAGEIPVRMLGCRVASFDESGAELMGEQGELVITAPMPSMPVEFWGDDDGSRYEGAYFDAYPGVWRHGDWLTIHPDGALVISGRSDATLNRGGVRVGTAEFYRVVDEFPEVADSLVVHLDDTDDGMGTLLLFVHLSSPGLDEALGTRLRHALRTSLSPRHVPDEIIEVTGVPRTLSGKRLEVPVKRILSGADATTAAAAGALRNPASLDQYVDYAARRQP